MNVEALSEEEMKATLYKVDIELFWEAEKIIFNIEIQKYILHSVRFSIYEILFT